jgi:uncharacterized protein (TIGR03435 family)
MSKLVLALTAPLHCPLQDRTGLAGRYDFVLQYSPDQDLGATYGSPPATGYQDPATAPTNSSGPSLFTAVQERLVLKLIAVTIPSDGILIVRIERPSKN